MASPKPCLRVQQDSSNGGREVPTLAYATGQQEIASVIILGYYNEFLVCFIAHLGLSEYVPLLLEKLQGSLQNAPIIKQCLLALKFAGNLEVMLEIACCNMQTDGASRAAQ